MPTAAFWRGIADSLTVSPQQLHNMILVRPNALRLWWEARHALVSARPGCTQRRAACAAARLQLTVRMTPYDAPVCNAALPVVLRTLLLHFSHHTSQVHRAQHWP
jgi:hypothetical protein